ncbi:ABC transporter permease [uncultured Chitinophaga sp.]|jgi:ABC-type antimicrobial peptide transport system, permease component|uniref:ABC transporter permease n=1 Tax=uncultured Chitinophaga sp. TaxID=339340 RepID=UPI002621920C|nr:ABC transporter permease [uncultured Chitinophaga sp.]
MQHHHLRVAWRNLWKDRFYSIINISGLALAAAAFLLIIHYAGFEYSYENGYKKADNIYRVTLDLYKDGAYVVTDCETHPPMGPELKQQMPEVRDFARMQNMDLCEIINPPATAIRTDRVYAADPSVFSIFNYEFIKGNPAKALRGDMEAILTETTARKLFGNADPLGQALGFRGKTLTVTGVIRDLPPNTHLKIDMLVPFSIVQQFGINVDSWQGNNNYTYLEMAPHTNLAAFNRKLKAFSLAKKELRDKIFTAEPIKQIHLHSKKTFEPEVNGDARTVQFLLTVAFLILLIGTVNYVNLTTARAAERLKEASIKKILGASRFTLIRQFFTESVIINLLACTLALLIIQLAQPYYMQLTGMPARIRIFNSASFWYYVAGLFVLNCLLSGVYPSIALSAAKAVHALNRSFTNALKGGALRKILVIAQFTVACIVLVTSIIVQKQLHFMRNQELGMNLDGVLAIRGADLDKDSTSTLLYKQELLQLPGVKKVSLAGAVPGLPVSDLSTTSWVTIAGQHQTSSFNYYVYPIDADFLPAMNMQLAAGKNFIAGTPNNNKVIINEEAARKLGFQNAEAAVGRKVAIFGQEMEVTGVVKNYHQLSLKEALLPIIHWYYEGNTTLFVIKADTRSMSRTISAAEEKWKQYFKAHPFEYRFADDQFNQQYQSDTRFGQIVNIFSLFTVFITCLGLLGLTAYSVSRRTKEIGIRKVLGASVTGIIHLLTKDFIRLVIAAVIIATPFAWYAMQQWLQNFTYRIDIPWWAFVITGALLAAVAVVTVGLQSLKTALANPVNSLGKE